MRSMMHWVVALRSMMRFDGAITVLYCYIALGVKSQPQRHHH